MSNELQKDDFILPGGFDITLYNNGELQEVTKINRTKSATILTLSQVVSNYLDKEANIEDAEFEIIPQKQITQ